MTDDDNEPILSPMEAAEDYRRQRVEAAARKSEVKTLSRAELYALIAAERVNLLPRIEALGLTSDEANAALDEYLQGLAAEPDRGPGSEPVIQKILSDLVGTVMRLAPKTGRGGVVFGPSGELNLAASELSIPELDISKIDVGYGFNLACHLASTLLIHSFTTEDEVSPNADAALARVMGDRLLLAHWSSLIIRCAWEGMPPPSSSWSLGPAPNAADQHHLLRAMELFAIAHEYTHHALSHTVGTTSLPDRDPNLDEEEADIGGYMISRLSTLDTPNPFAESGAGAAAVLCFLDIVRKAEFALAHGPGDPPPRDDHPPTRERLALLGAVDAGVADQTAKAYRDAFADFFDLLWEKLKPGMLALRGAGHLPERGGGKGWLP